MPSILLNLPPNFVKLELILHQDGNSQNEAASIRKDITIISSPAVWCFGSVHPVIYLSSPTCRSSSSPKKPKTVTAHTNLSSIPKTDTLLTIENYPLPILLTLLTNTKQERIAKILDISRITLHYGYLPLILYLGSSHSLCLPMRPFSQKHSRYS